MLKKQLFGLGFSLASIFFMASSASAYEPISDISLTGGYRSDEIKNTTRSFDVIGGNRGEFKLKRLRTWEFGVRGQYAITGFSCGCDDAWLDKFYVKGSALWGWGNNGKAEFGTSNGSGDYSSYSSNFNDLASFGVHRTKTYDYTIGAGWVYEIDCNWAIAPTVGYAWDKLTTKAKNRNSSDVSGFSDAYSSSDYSSSFGSSYSSGPSPFEFTQKWRGPWLGLELLYEDCEWHFDLGYEFHWASHRSSFSDFETLGVLGGGRKISTHSSSRYGNLVYVDAWYDLCDGWEIGLGFKYSYFQSGKTKRGSGSGSGSSGSLLVVDDAVSSIGSGSGSGSGNRGHSTWSTWGVTVDLGYKF